MADADYDTVLTAYRTLLQRFPEAPEKGKKVRYTSRNGHMTSFVSPDAELCLRLSNADKTAFLEAFPGPPVTQYGAVMKEYVHVPGALMRDVDALAFWFEKGLEYVGGLKPK